MKQVEIFGIDSINKLASILTDIEAKKVFIVHGKSSFNMSGAKNKIETLLKEYEKKYFYDFSYNPEIKDIEKGIKFYKKNDYDTIIAIGGGSTIDIAKSINILAEQPGKGIDYITKKKEIENRGKPLIVIPTTSGSGSQATHFSVVYINGKKYSLSHNYILPDYSIVDPILTESLPSRITATTGLDALCQAIESYWAIGSTRESKYFAKRSIDLILKNLCNVVIKPSIENRKEMAEAAHLAGKAINISKTTASHAISYPITYHFCVQHGHAVALTLRAMFIENSQINSNNILDPRGEKYVLQTMNELYDILGVSNAQLAFNKINNLMKTINLETKLSELGITSEGIKKIIKEINIERLVNNPVKIDKKTLNEILVKIM